MLKKDTRKKILLVACNSLELGGIQTVIMSIVRSLSDKYVFDIVVFSGNNDKYSKEFLSYGGKIFVLKHYFGHKKIIKKIDYLTRYIREYPRIKRIIKENGPYEAIHCHNFLESAIYVKAAKKCCIPARLVHCHSHFRPFPKRKIITRFYSNMYRDIIKNNATKILACSHVAGEWLTDNKIEFTIVNNAVDLNRFKFFDGTPSSIDPWSIIHVGRWGGPKNQLFLLNVVYEIKKIKSNVKLSLIGYGLKEDKMAIEKTIEELGLKDNTTFYPGDSNIPELLSKNNVFVFPSLFEGLPIALIEAQATGMKCFASTAIPTQANLGLVDYIPLEKGPKYWAERIIDYIEKYGNERRFVSMDSFDIKNIAKQYESYYRGC